MPNDNGITKKLNGSVKISIKTLLISGSLLVAITVYIVTGIVGLNTQMRLMEKRVDRIEENSDKIVTYLGMMPAKK